MRKWKVDEKERKDWKKIRKGKRKRGGGGNRRDKEKDKKMVGVVRKRKQRN